MLTEQNQKWVEETIANIINKMSWVSGKSKDKIPFTTINGTHDDRRINVSGRIEDGINWWTNGFFAGMMWLMYHETKEEKYAKIAENTEIVLDQCFVDYYGLHHDVGFMWLPSAVTRYKLTGDEESRKRGMHAANLLAGRFNPAGKFIRAWNDLRQNDTRGWAIIDCMFNIPLLYWASEESKDPRFEQIARIHADTVMENFIREDGSSEHIVEFDPFKGGIIRTYGGQGYADGTSWTRGQSWALYGFVMSYKHTKDKKYLETAKKVAHYFIENIPDSGLIPIDFKQPEQPAFEDSTAATIASCGLIELSHLVEGNESELFLESAVKMLKALEEKHCNWTEESDSIVAYCSGSYHDTDHHISIIYGDYFFMEAIFKLKGNDLFIW